MRKAVLLTREEKNARNKTRRGTRSTEITNRNAKRKGKRGPEYGKWKTKQQDKSHFITMLEDKVKQVEGECKSRFDQLLNETKAECEREKLSMHNFACETYRKLECELHACQEREKVLRKAQEGEAQVRNSSGQILPSAEILRLNIQEGDLRKRMQEMTQDNKCKDQTLNRQAAELADLQAKLRACADWSECLALAKVEVAKDSFEDGQLALIMKFKSMDRRAFLQFVQNIENPRVVSFEDMPCMPSRGRKRPNK